MTEAEKPIEQKLIDPKALAEVSNRVDLDAIRLEGIGAKRIVELSSQAPALILEFEYNSGWRRRDDRPGFDIRFEFSSSLSQAVSGTNTAAQCLSFKAIYILEYRLPESAPADWDEKLNMFAAVNGVINVWPYVRAEFASTLTKIGFPPLMIPIYRPGRPTKGRIEFKASEEQIAPT